MNTIFGLEIIRGLLFWVCFCVLFFLINTKLINKKDVALIISMITIIIIISISTDKPFDILINFVLYIYYHKKVESRAMLITVISLVSCIVTYSYILSSFLTMIIVDKLSSRTFEEFLVNLLIEIILLIGIILLIKLSKLSQRLVTVTSETTASASIFLLITTYTYLYASYYYEVSQYLIGYTLLFLSVETVFVVIIIMVNQEKLSRKLEKQTMKQQLETLQIYSEQLENEQMKLRKFKHDYKNLLLALKTELSHLNNKSESVIEKFESYSEKQLSSIIWSYKDMNNIKILNLKSLLINKLLKAQNGGITIHFECREIINQLTMNEYDYLRVIGNLLDNAIEASLESEKKKVEVCLYIKEKQFNVVISNTYKEKVKLSKITNTNFTTKKGHLGLGLSNIEMIKKRSPNLFIQYQVVEQNFFVKVTLDLRK